MPGGEAPSKANESLWRSTGLVRHYANRTLRPVETVVLVRWRDELRGRVLELGCGAGRLTGYLGEIAERAEGLDMSEEMLEAGRSDYPAVTFSQGDVRDLSRYDDGSWDAVWGSYNLPDLFDHDERLRMFGEVHRVLAGDGLFIFSSHNLAAEHTRQKPTDLRTSDPLRLAVDLARMPRRVRNSRRVRRSERREGTYALLNDISHDFRGLHYYIARDEQERQLREHGFELLECLDLDGRPVAAGSAAVHSQELHYVARRR